MLKIVIDVPESREKAKIDKLGRVAIPAAYRKKLNFKEEENVTIIPTHEGILIMKNQDFENIDFNKKILEKEIANIVEKYIKDEKERI